MPLADRIKTENWAEVPQQLCFICCEKMVPPSSKRVTIHYSKYNSVLKTGIKKLEYPKQKMAIYLKEAQDRSPRHFCVRSRKPILNFYYRQKCKLIYITTIWKGWYHDRKQIQTTRKAMRHLRNCLSQCLLYPTHHILASKTGRPKHNMSLSRQLCA